MFGVGVGVPCVVPNMRLAYDLYLCHSRVPLGAQQTGAKNPGARRESGETGENLLKPKQKATTETKSRRKSAETPSEVFLLTLPLLVGLLLGGFKGSATKDIIQNAV